MRPDKRCNHEAYTGDIFFYVYFFFFCNPCFLAGRRAGDARKVKRIPKSWIKCIINMKLPRCSFFFYLSSCIYIFLWNRGCCGAWCVRDSSTDNKESLLTDKESLLGRIVNCGGCRGGNVTPHIVHAVALTSLRNVHKLHSRASTFSRNFFFFRNNFFFFCNEKQKAWHILQHTIF